MDALLSIPIGVITQLIVFMLLRQTFRLPAKAAALIVGSLVLALYVPYAILLWPGADVVAMNVAIFLVCAYALGLIFAHREARLDDQRGFHWGPAVIVAFFVFLVLFDSALVLVATQGLPEPVARLLLPKSEQSREISSAFPGVVANDMQKKEALYNAYLQQVQAQQARGWVVRKGWLGGARAGQPARFQVSVEDRDGRPISGAQVHGEFLRAADTRQDQAFALTETAAGVYQAELVLPLPGVWELMLQVRRGDDLHELRATTEVAE